MEHELDFLKPLILEMFPTGSRVICNPPPTDTDEDWCVLYNKRNDFHSQLIDRGYYFSGKYYNKITSKFITYRHADNPINLIMTKHRDFYDRFKEATEIATQENLLNKEDRVKLFELILRNKR